MPATILRLGFRSAAAEKRFDVVGEQFRVLVEEPATAAECADSLRGTPSSARFCDDRAARFSFALLSHVKAFLSGR
jgi:hypothetical protein